MRDEPPVAGPLSHRVKEEPLSRAAGTDVGCSVYWGISMPACLASSYKFHGNVFFFLRTSLPEVLCTFR